MSSPAMKLLHPYMPFVTEGDMGISSMTTSIMISAWPVYDAAWNSPKMKDELVMDTAKAARI